LFLFPLCISISSCCNIKTNTSYAVTKKSFCVDCVTWHLFKRLNTH
jgi:hypothetical protein